MALVRGATLGTINKVAPPSMPTKSNFITITQQVLQTGFGPYVLRTMLTQVPMCPNTG